MTIIMDPNKITIMHIITLIDIFLLSQKISISIVNNGAMVPKNAALAIFVIFTAVKKSNIDVGARTMEINNVEYVIRGLGLIGDLEDIEQTVVKVTDNVPIKIKNSPSIIFSSPEGTYSDQFPDAIYQKPSTICAASFAVT